MLLLRESGEESPCHLNLLLRSAPALMVCNEPADVVAPPRIGSATRFDHTRRLLRVADDRGVARGFGTLPIEATTISVPCSGELLLLRCYPDPPPLSAEAPPKVNSVEWPCSAAATR